MWRVFDTSLLLFTVLDFKCVLCFAVSNSEEKKVVTQLPQTIFNCLFFFFFWKIPFNHKTCIVLWHLFYRDKYHQLWLFCFGFPVTIESNHSASKKELSRKPDAVLVLPMHGEPQRHDCADSPHCIFVVFLTLKLTSVQTSGPTPNTSQQQLNIKTQPVCDSSHCLLCSVSSLLLGFFVFQVIYPHHSKLSEKEVSHIKGFHFAYMSQTCCVLVVNSRKTAWHRLWYYILASIFLLFLHCRPLFSGFWCCVRVWLTQTKFFGSVSENQHLLPLLPRLQLRWAPVPSARLIKYSWQLLAS